MHAIFEPVFARMFNHTNTNDNNNDNSDNDNNNNNNDNNNDNGDSYNCPPPPPPPPPEKEPLDLTMVHPYMRGQRRGGLVGCLWILMKEAKEKNAKARANEGKNEPEEDDEEDFHSSRIKWARVLLEMRGRCLLLIRVHIEAVSVDVIKAIDDEEESPLSSEYEPVLQVSIAGNTFHAVTLNTRLARASMTMAHASLLDTRAISMDWHYRSLLTTGGDIVNSTGEPSQVPIRPSPTDPSSSSSSSSSSFSPFMDLNFVERKTDIKVVDVTLRNMLATIAIDALRDIGEVVR